MNYPQDVEDFEISVVGERFRVSERVQPSGQMSYDFSWLNGPADGTYGFTTTFFSVRTGERAVGHDPSSGSDAELRAGLTESARGFVESFYATGGIGESDFPDHVRANPN